MPPEPLDKVVQLRLSESERKMLEGLAERWGVKLSQALRRLIREAHERISGKGA